MAPPTPTGVGSLLRQVVYYHLDNGSLDNALFFAERFAAHDARSGDAAYLVSLCHLRLGDHRSAYDTSKPLGCRGASLGCSWLLAQACLALERYKEGISALEASRTLWIQKSLMGRHGATSRAAGPDAPAVLALLGKLYRGYDDQGKAIGCFEDALKINPFQWDAFKALCDMGVKVRVPNVFRPSEGLVHCLNPAGFSSSFDAASNKRSSQRGSVVSAAADPFGAGYSSSDPNAPSDSMMGAEGDLAPKMQGPTRARVGNTATATPNQHEMEGAFLADIQLGSRSNAAHQEPPQAPARRTRNMHQQHQQHQQQVGDVSMEAAPPPPPRINSRLGARRGVSTRDKNHQEASSGEYAPEDANPGALNGYSSRFSRAMSPMESRPMERKRTLSGHPAPRPANTEELGTRRSARLTRPSTRANPAAVTSVNAAVGGGPGVAGGRELKKARPQVSRIVRPGSGAPSNVGRVVSGNRKPPEEQHPTDEQCEAKQLTVAVAVAPTTTTATTATIATTTTTTAAAAAAAAAARSGAAEPETTKLEEALRSTLELLRKLGSGYQLMTQFQCQEAVQALSTLPPSQQGSAWVLGLLGRAHHELGQYVEADKFFRRMRTQAPSRVEDTEVYSTTLWHLKREAELSFLAHELVEGWWHAPQAWCALGNAWSLARDGESALRCFKRATQLDGRFAYGFTLQGHELAAAEEYDKALRAYRQAVSADRRHYNAHYGMGRVQQRLGAHDKALRHFQAAAAINPRNAVLVCSIGTALERQKQVAPALRAYARAVELAPRAASTRYRKARALLAAGQVDEARRELLVLKDLAPDEGTVHFLLATLYRSTGEKQLAVRHFTIALALDPKIKEAIESFEDDVQMEDSM